MPELPEVETTLRGIKPHIFQQKIMHVIVRQHKLRWLIPSNIKQKLMHKKVIQVERRAKYLLLRFSEGSLMIHLGMSGSLRILTKQCPPKKHDHVDIEFANNTILRFTDPRRFGALIWTDEDPYMHPLLALLGPEPLTTPLLGCYLWRKAQARKMPIKQFIMDSKVVAGIGNIYATEALFAAKIHPNFSAKNISQSAFKELAKAIKLILRQAIQQGGTTLKDFVKSDGKPGYFINKLKVYQRAGLPCMQCGVLLISMIIGQRGTVYCKHCQKYGA